MVSASRAKRDIWTFLTLLLLFSSLFYSLVFLVADAPKQWSRYALPFMWPAGLLLVVLVISPLTGLISAAGEALSPRT